MQQSASSGFLQSGTVTVVGCQGDPLRAFLDNRACQNCRSLVMVVSGKKLGQNQSVHACVPFIALEWRAHLNHRSEV